MRHRRSHRRGISLMLVTAFVAAASVLGLALLSSAALQSAATRNQDLVVQADGLAESGVNVGLYWVQNLGDSAKVPSNVNALEIGKSTTQKSLALKNVPGKFDVTVTRLSYNRYEVASRGKSKSDDTDSPDHTLTAQADANYYGYAISATNATSGTLAIPATTTIDGDVFSSVPVTVATGASVNGTVYDAPPSSTGSSSGSGGGLLGGLVGGVLNLVTGTLNAVVATLVPTPATANHYDSYTYKNKTYAAVALPATVANATYGPDPSTNPLGVFYHKGTLTLGGGAKINGTVVVKDNPGGLLGLGAEPGVLKVTGKGNAITQATPNYPALVADSHVSFEAAGATLDITGLAYTGGQITHAGNVADSALNVTGALLFGGTSAALDAAVRTRLTYDRVRASVPSLVTNTTPMPTSVTVVYWKN